jgi:hypothetical protein
LEPGKCNKIWIHDLTTTVDTLPDIYSMSLCITKDAKLQNLQFTLLHISLPCSSYLYKCGLYAWKLKKNMLHLFWNCNLVQHFWFYVNNFLKIYAITHELNPVIKSFIL